VCKGYHCVEEVYEALQAQDRLKARGIDLIAVITMDTPFVMQAWADQLGAGKDFLFLSDVQGQLAKSLGTTFQAGRFGLRPTRCVS
jgi:peroxiredoxin